MKLLLAEDEMRMASALTELLKMENYDVDHVSDGSSALAALESDIYDAAIIDVMMPGMNGFDVVYAARNRGIKTPVLMLTAKSTVDDKVTGHLILDPAAASLSCTTTGQIVRLGEKELRIMEYMIANQGQILSREQLAVKIWGFESDAEYNNVEVYMSFTRKKLLFIGSRTEIKAIRGIGYELRCPDVS